MIIRLLSFLLLLYALGYALFVVLLPQPAGDRRTDGVVVLTGGPNRLQQGIEVLERGLAGRLLISGVERTVRPADLTEAHDIDPALFECCIDLGREAVDTRSNADEVARWVEKRDFRSVRLITTDWHMPRARFEIERRLGDGVTVVADAVPSNPRFRQLYTEYNKFLLRRAAELIGI